MFQHLPELLIVLVLALIVFGPEKLPEVAANAGKMVRQAREMLDDAMNPQEVEAADDFHTYYYESLARSGEDVPSLDDDVPLQHERSHSPYEVGDPSEQESDASATGPSWQAPNGESPYGRALKSENEDEEPAGKPL